MGKRVRAQDSGDRALGQLDQDALLQLGQLDREKAVWSTTEVLGSSGPGAPKDGPYVIESKIKLARKLGGLSVAGNAVTITVDNMLHITSINVRWRQVEAVEDVSVVRNSGEALQVFHDFEKATTLTRTTHRAELAYVDAGVRNRQEYLEPWHFYVYQDAERNNPGKKRIHLVQAIQAPQQALTITGEAEAVK